MKTFDMGFVFAAGFTLLWVAIFMACVLAWITHIVWCIGHAAWVLLVLGALFFPVGIIHGFMVWFS